MPLTDAEIRSLKPAAKAYRRADAKCLYLEVTPRGSKLWRMKYRVHGKEKRLALGAYPEVKLGEARTRRDKARLQLIDGIDPCVERKRQKDRARYAAGSTFGAIAREYILKMKADGRAEATLAKARWFLSQLEPAVGSMTITDIEPQTLLAPLKKLEGRGTYETAKKTRSFASRVFRFAIQTGRGNVDPASLLQGALITRAARNYAAILEPEALGGLLRAIDDYDGHPTTKAALQILPHVFVRPGEIRLADWSELDFEKSVWLIPAGRMKMRRPHAVPLSRFVAERFLRLYAITGPKGFVFPAVHTDRKPMSENTLNAALRRMGFSKDEICAHGFRSTASTILNECGQWSPDAIERALGHRARDTVRGAYDRGERWQERVRMAEWWSVYLERIKRAVAHDKNRFVQSIAQGRFPRHPQRIDQAQINTESRD